MSSISSVIFSTLIPSGTNKSDYMGHVFWDMETWMYPPFLMFRPDLAKQMLSYRIHTMEAAFKNANRTGKVYLQSLEILLKAFSARGKWALKAPSHKML